MQFQEDILSNIRLFLGGSTPKLVERNVKPLVRFGMDFVELVTLLKVLASGS
jgi:hypothetical protein